MQAIDASVILEDAYRLIGWDAAQLETRQQQIARQAFSMALQEVWDAWWWQELMQSAQVVPAKMYYPGWTYYSLDVAYFPATQKFYQAIQTTAGHDPATLGTDGGYTVNGQYWAEAQPTYAAGDYDPTKLYNNGDQVRNPADGLYYQQFQPNPYYQVRGAGNIYANGDYYGYVKSGDAATFFRYESNHWNIYAGNHLVYQGVEDVASPDLVTTWTTAGDTVYEPVPTVTLAYAPAPIDGFWCQLLPYVPELQTVGEVRAIAQLDPRNGKNSFMVPFERTLTGYRLPGWTQGVPWVWYRRPTPIITGDDFDANVSYDPTPAASVPFP